MPDPDRRRRSRKPNATERPEQPDPPKGPLWARAVHLFYDPAFDMRSRAGFQTALDDFVELPDGERAFHETHLLYRVVQGLEGIHAVLTRIERKLDGAVSPDLSALEHLAPIRAALDEIASGQSDLIEAVDFDGEDEDEVELDDLEEDPDPGEEDPDFVYDTVPEDEPERPRRPRPGPPASSDAPRPPRAAPPRPAAPRSAPPADPDREALIGELVPASERPHDAGEGER